MLKESIEKERLSRHESTSKSYLGIRSTFSHDMVKAADARAGSECQPQGFTSRENNQVMEDRCQQGDDRLSMGP